MNKRDVLKTAFGLIEKQYGEGSIFMGDEEMLDVDAIPSGSLGVDHAAGVGGYPRGRIIEIFGKEASGKTTLTLHAIAEAQKLGGLCAFVDAENALDKDYAQRLGCNIKELSVSQPNSGEEALNIVEILVRTGALDLIVVDSVAALVPQAEIDGEMGDHHIGVQARLMSQACRKLSKAVSVTKTVLIFINQTRDKIGVMFGSKVATSGGNALKFYASQRLEVTRIASLKQGDEVIGGRTRVKFAKNKVAAPLKVSEFDLLYGQGVNRAGEVLDAAVDLKLVKKSGAWYSHNDLRIGQGRINAYTALRNDPELLASLEADIYKHYNIPTVGDTDAT